MPPNLTHSSGPYFPAAAAAAAAEHGRQDAEHAHAAAAAATTTATAAAAAADASERSAGPPSLRDAEPDRAAAAGRNDPPGQAGHDTARAAGSYWTAAAAADRSAASTGPGTFFSCATPILLVVCMHVVDFSAV